MWDGHFSSYINCLYLKIHFSPSVNNIENSLSLDSRYSSLYYKKCKQNSIKEEINPPRTE